MDPERRWTIEKVLYELGVEVATPIDPADSAVVGDVRHSFADVGGLERRYAFIDV